MSRRVLVITLSAVVGCLAGLLAPVILVAALVWNDRNTWSLLTDPDAVPYFAVLVGLGTLNGAVGAWDGWWSDARRPGPVAWSTALLLLYPAVLCGLEPSDSKTWGPALVVVGIVAPLVWVAGRVGQEVGVVGRRRASATTP